MTTALTHDLRRMKVSCDGIQYLLVATVFLGTDHLSKSDVKLNSLTTTTKQWDGARIMTRRLQHTMSPGSSRSPHVYHSQLSEDDNPPLVTTPSPVGSSVLPVCPPALVSPDGDGVTQNTPAPTPPHQNPNTSGHPTLPPILALPAEIIGLIFEKLETSNSVLALILSAQRFHAVWTGNAESICRVRITQFFEMATEIGFIQEEESCSAWYLPSSEGSGRTTAIIVPLALIPPCIAHRFLDERYAVCSAYQRTHFPEMPTIRERTSSDPQQVQILFQDFWQTRLPFLSTSQGWSRRYKKVCERGLKHGGLDLRNWLMWDALLSEQRLGGGGFLSLECTCQPFNSVTCQT